MRLWLLSVAVVVAALLPVAAFGQDALVATEMLGRPTDNSIWVYAVSGFATDAYVQYGTVSGVYPNSTSIASFAATDSIAIVVSGLSADTKYYYRFCYRRTGNPTFIVRDEHYFHTQRPPGSTYKFTIQSDSHMYQPNFSHALMLITTQSELSAAPDFTIDMGDTYGNDTAPATTTLADEMFHHLHQRQYFGTLCHSSPLFFAPGNHEGEKGYYLNGSVAGTTPESNLAAYSTRARHFYYENPVPDAFYTGNTTVEGYGIGLPQNYYAWTWGDALYVVLDFYRYSTAAERTTGWDVTLGKTQYDWLKQTLEGSSAKYKFIFFHKMGEVRGLAVWAKRYEWGGYEMNNTTYTFATQRPGWAMPVHQLLLANRVTACFAGHDHLYAYEKVDGIVYQECPMPADTTYLFDWGHAADYTGTDIHQNSGHVRVSVAPTGVQVDYVRSALPGDAPEGVANGGIVFSYSIYPLTASAGANGSIVPNGTVTVTNGSSQHFSIAPGTGYHVATLTVDGSPVTPDTTYTFSNVASAHSISATFALPTTTYTLTYTAGLHGVINGSSPQTVASGGSGSPVTAVADAGYHFVSWSDDGLTHNASRTDVNVTADLSVSATFAANPGVTAPTLTVSQQLTGNDPGNTTKINLGWGALESGQTIEIWRAGFGHYPEYDDAGGTAVTTVPPEARWTCIALGLGGVSYADAPVDRDYYYYAAFVTDGYGTRSAVSNVGSALDYHLGDVSNGTTPGTGNDRVLLEDFSLLGAHYGATLAVADPLGYLDVGPTSTGWLDGVPTTDNRLEFEDLVMFSRNYWTASAPQSSARPVALAAAGSDALVLDRPQKVALGAPVTVELTLQGSGTLRALSTKLAWDAAVVEPVGYEPGAWLTAQNGVAFSPKPGAVDAAVLRAAGLKGEGLLATVNFKVLAAGDPKIRIGALDGRDAGNHKVAVAQSERVQAPQAPTETRLESAQPNPFRGTTALAFSLAQRGAVELAIYAVDGRRMRTLVSAVREPGVYRESWDGTDEQGRATPVGVYYARLTAGKVQMSRAIVYVR